MSACWPRKFLLVLFGVVGSETGSWQISFSWAVAWAMNLHRSDVNSFSFSYIGFLHFGPSVWYNLDSVCFISNLDKTIPLKGFCESLNLQEISVLIIHNNPLLTSESSVKKGSSFGSSNLTWCCKLEGLVEFEKKAFFWVLFASFHKLYKFRPIFSWVTTSYQAWFRCHSFSSYFPDIFLYQTTWNGWHIHDYLSSL